MQGTRPTRDVVNKQYTPEGNQRKVLNVFRDEYQVNPTLIRERTGIKRQRINDSLKSLRDAGWVTKRCRGLYQLVYDGDGFTQQQIVYRDGGHR